MIHSVCKKQNIAAIIPDIFQRKSDINTGSHRFLLKYSVSFIYLAQQVILSARYIVFLIQIAEGNMDINRLKDNAGSQIAALQQPVAQQPEQNYFTQNAMAQASLVQESLSTGDLLALLKSSPSLSSFLSDHQSIFKKRSTGELIEGMIRKRGITKSDLSKRAGISWVYLYQILTNRRHPSRNCSICIGLAIPCSLDEIQILLSNCGYSKLDIRNRRDAIIIYGILHQQNMSTVNDELFEAGEATLN